MSKKSETPNYSFEILNHSEGEFRATARTIAFDNDSLDAYRNNLEVSCSGLYMHVGSWKQHLLTEFADFEEEFMSNVTTGYDNGVVMTYELLRRVGAKHGQEVRNPRFDSSNYYADTEISAVKVPKGLLAGSNNGVLLPSKFPKIYKSAATMIGRVLHEPPSLVESRINNPRREIAEVYIAHFVMGAAEVVLPLERYAEVDKLSRMFE